MNEIKCVHACVRVCVCSCRDCVRKLISSYTWGTGMPRGCVWM